MKQVEVLLWNKSTCNKTDKVLQLKKSTPCIGTSQPAMKTSQHPVKAINKPIMKKNNHPDINKSLFYNKTCCEIVIKQVNILIAVRRRRPAMKRTDLSDIIQVNSKVKNLQ